MWNNCCVVIEWTYPRNDPSNILGCFANFLSQLMFIFNFSVSVVFPNSLGRLAKRLLMAQYHNCGVKLNLSQSMLHGEVIGGCSCFPLVTWLPSGVGKCSSTRTGFQQLRYSSLSNKRRQAIKRSDVWNTLSEISIVLYNKHSERHFFPLYHSSFIA